MKNALNTDQLKNFIRMCSELACLLEVSASPKPGNVHRFRDFIDLRYEDFLASSVSFGFHVEQLALKGLYLKEAKIGWGEITLGKIIFEAVKSSTIFHHHGNTNLGIILLLSPLAIAAGYSIDRNNSLCNTILLQKNAQKIIKKTTIEDSLYTSKAILHTSPGGLGKVEKYDVNDPELYNDLKKDNTNLFKLMESCKSRDNICFELSQNYPITFSVGVPRLIESMNKCHDINLSIVNTYLEILANYPDTLIKRKYGQEKAMDISHKAKLIMQLGGVLTTEGRMELEEFDIELQEEEEKINPGTSADIVAATIFVYLLSGGKI